MVILWCMDLRFPMGVFGRVMPDFHAVFGSTEPALALTLIVMEANGDIPVLVLSRVLTDFHPVFGSPEPPLTLALTLTEWQT